MARVSPLRERHAQTGARFAPCGPPDAAIPVVDAFDALELEYAAIRKGAALFDEPHFGAIEALGGERLDFLDRMLTQRLRDLPAGASLDAFWLTRQGRITADVRVVALADRALLGVAAHAAAATIESLGAYLFAEDVELVDATDRLHRFSLHGPKSIEALGAAGASRDALARLAEPNRNARVEIAGASAVVDRCDLTGEVGVSFFVESAAAPVVWNALLEGGARPIGWRALNTARVEAGSPLFMVDFGPDSLPHETGVVRDRVSFSKGCYLGQEVVARMESRGRSAKRLAALRLERVAGKGLAAPIQPMTGDAVRTAPGGDVVGAITSSVVSPMLGDAPVCLAMMKSTAGAPGARLVVEAQGRSLTAIAQESLRFWPLASTAHRRP